MLSAALDVQEEKFGSDHMTVAITLNNMGWLYREWGRPAEAETALLRSLSIRESLFGKDHPQVSTVLLSLGELQTEEDRFEEAESYLLRHDGTGVLLSPTP